MELQGLRLKNMLGAVKIYLTLFRPIPATLPSGYSLNLRVTLDPNPPKYESLF